MWNILIREYAQGQYITNASPDDRRHPTSLQRQMDFLNAQPDYAIVAGSVRACPDVDPDMIDWLTDKRCSTWFGEQTYFFFSFNFLCFCV